MEHFYFLKGFFDTISMMIVGIIYLLVVGVALKGLSKLSSRPEVPPWKPPRDRPETDSVVTPPTEIIEKPKVLTTAAGAGGKR